MMQKPTLLFNRLIFPTNLSDVLDEYDPKDTLGLFIKKDYVSCICIIDTDEKRLDSVMTEIGHTLLTEVYGGMLSIFIDGLELTERIDDIRRQLNGGIKEDNFIDWFMMMAFQLSQIHLPANEEGKIKDDYLPRVQYYSIANNERTHFIGFILSFSRGSLSSDANVHQFISSARKIANNILTKGSKGNIKKIRQPIDSRLRHEVFKRDNYRCKECGATNKECVLHVDHILPVSQGGTDELTNLQTLCQNCNLAKSNKKWVADQKEVANG